MRTLALLALVASLSSAQHVTIQPGAELTPEGAKSAARGIDWLLKIQGRDGWWGEDAGLPPDVACTSMAGLAILASGETTREGKHRKAVALATRAVADRVMQSRGSLINGESSISTYLGAYIHEYTACLFLAESLGMQSDPAQDEIVRKAVRRLAARIEKLQDADGSWNDGIEPLNTTAIAYVALRAAHNAGIVVPTAKLDRAIAYIEKRFDLKEKILQDPRHENRRRFTSTAGALRVLMGQGRALTPQAQLGLSLLRQVPFGRDYGDQVSGEDFFGGVLGSQALMHEEGDTWREVFAKMQKVLVDCQNADGSWTGHHCISARTFCTACAVLTLETPLRLLPSMQL